MNEEPHSGVESSIRFSAPWGMLLKAMTLLSSSLLVAITFLGVFTGPRDNVFWILTMIVLPPVVLVFSALFSIRGYRLSPDTLLVERLGWCSKVDLTNLTAVYADPMAMARSVRLFGNGGMFCYAGLFRNKTLGVYRVFATSPSHSVVLKSTGRTIVVTPDRPEEFVSALVKMRGLT